MPAWMSNKTVPWRCVCCDFDNKGTNTICGESRKKVKQRTVGHGCAAPRPPAIANSFPSDRPPYWRSDGKSVGRFETRYMRRKLQHLLDRCAYHPDGTRCDCDERALDTVQVIRVERIENDELWQNYSKVLADVTAKVETPATVELSRPVRCAMSDHEKYLFHGTKVSNIESIAKEGLDPDRAHPNSRYGMGVYFSDQSCKAHTYAKNHPSETGLLAMIYCRVVMGEALVFQPNEATNFLIGMKAPRPSDSVFGDRCSG